MSRESYKFNIVPSLTTSEAVSHKPALIKVLLLKKLCFSTWLFGETGIKYNTRVFPSSRVFTDEMGARTQWECDERPRCSRVAVTDGIVLLTDFISYT